MPVRVETTMVTTSQELPVYRIAVQVERIRSASRTGFQPVWFRFRHGKI